MPPTEPIAPPEKPQVEPAPKPPPTPSPQRRRELDPFRPSWPETRPLPEPKARVRT
jgi:hypothetical protein